MPLFTPGVKEEKGDGKLPVTGGVVQPLNSLMFSSAGHLAFHKARSRALTDIRTNPMRSFGTLTNTDGLDKLANVRAVVGNGVIKFKTSALLAKMVPGAALGADATIANKAGLKWGNFWQSSKFAKVKAPILTTSEVASAEGVMGAKIAAAIPIPVVGPVVGFLSKAAGPLSLAPATYYTAKENWNSPQYAKEPLSKRVGETAAVAQGTLTWGLAGYYIGTTLAAAAVTAGVAALGVATAPAWLTIGAGVLIVGGCTAIGTAIGPHAGKIAYRCQSKLLELGSGALGLAGKAFKALITASEKQAR